jgi:glutaredoxin 3
MKMSDEVYIKRGCPFCDRALDILGQLGRRVTVIDLYERPRDQRQAEVIRLIQSNGLTVPQIFIDGSSIGGCSELEDAVRQGLIRPG